MSNWKLFGRFLGFALELFWICGLIAGGVALAWWIAG
jgi:hypothetical protein